jgi:hypothetical protein
LTRDLWVAKSPSMIKIIDWREFATKSDGRRDVDLDGDRRSGCGSAGRRGYSAEMKGAELNRRFNSAPAAIGDSAPWNQEVLTARMRNPTKSQKESQTARAAAVSPGFGLDTSF